MIDLGIVCFVLAACGLGAVVLMTLPLWRDPARPRRRLLPRARRRVAEQMRRPRRERDAGRCAAGTENERSLPAKRREPDAAQSAVQARAVLAPPRPERPELPEPTVRRLVIDGPDIGREREPALPSRVIAGGGWHGSFFHGWCGTSVGAHPVCRLNVRGVTLRGVTHAGLGTECQDAIGAAWDQQRNALYLGVADGLGSLPRSGLVAVEAIRAALHLCVNRPVEMAFADSGPRLFEAIAAGLVRSLADGSEGLNGACTLLVAEVVPQFDGAQVTVHGVGDSEAWALFNSSWTPIHHERRSADNATRELPGHVRPQTHQYDLSPGSVLVLGSDGFAGALDETISPLARSLARLWRHRAPGWLDFVNHVSFVDDYWSDDRSAVAVWIGEGLADA